MTNSKFDARWHEDHELPGEINAARCDYCGHVIRDEEDVKTDSEGNTYHEECYWSITDHGDGQSEGDLDY